MCECRFVVFFFKQKTAYEMRISDWSSDVCSSDLNAPAAIERLAELGVPFNAGEDFAERWHLTREAGHSHRRIVHVDDATGAAVQQALTRDRKSVVEGKSVSVRVDLGGRRSIKKKIRE